MVAIERLDDAALQDLARRTDRLGVLSVYVGADPVEDPHLQAATIDLRNRFRELQRRAGNGDVPGDGAQIAARLERMWPRVEALADPTLSGRGRIAFFALDDDWDLEFESAMPVANRLVLDEGPFIHPLLELLDEGRPAGVVLLSGAEARIMEWRLGSLHQVCRIEQEYVEAPHERSGQIGGGPRGQFHTPVREQRQARERELRKRFVDQVIKVTAEVAGDRRWEGILVSAGEQRTDEAVARFPQPLRDKVIADSRVLTGLPDAALAAAVSELAHEQHTLREGALVERVRDAGRSGTGALGLSEVVAALNSGRVAHLVYDPQVRYEGSIGADGTLFGADEAGPDQPSTPEPRLTERLVERALVTGARISPVEGAADDALADSAGVGALLRW